MDINVWIQNFIESYGLISIFIIVMLEYANLPLPSEIVLPFVGILVANNSVSFAGAIIVSVVAGLAGSITNYYLGYHFGTSLIKILVTKYPKIKKSAKSSSMWLRKYGKISVMITRIVPLARTFISIPAGISKMKVTEFIFFSAIGISFWNILLISLGYFVGDNLSIIVDILNKYSIIAIILGIILFLFYIFKIRINNK